MAGVVLKVLHLWPVLWVCRVSACGMRCLMYPLHLLGVCAALGLCDAVCDVPLGFVTRATCLHRWTVLCICICTVTHTSTHTASTLPSLYRLWIQSEQAAGRGTCFLGCLVNRLGVT